MKSEEIESCAEVRLHLAKKLSSEDISIEFLRVEILFYITSYEMIVKVTSNLNYKVRYLCVGVPESQGIHGELSCLLGLATF
jgi:hypothetical protein